MSIYFRKKHYKTFYYIDSKYDNVQENFNNNLQINYRNNILILFTILSFSLVIYSKL